MPGPLTHSPADVVRWLLVALGLGSSPALEPLEAWPVYTDNEPDLPDEVITTGDTSARDSGRVMYDGERAEFNGFQVRVRAGTFDVGYAKAHALAIAMDQAYQVVVHVGASSYRVQSISRTSDVLSLGKQVPGSKRSLFTVNALVCLRQLG